MSAADLTSVLEAASAAVAKRRDGHLPRPDRLRITALATQQAADPAVTVAVLDALPVVQLAHLVADEQLDGITAVLGFARKAIGGEHAEGLIRQWQDYCVAEGYSAWSARRDFRSQMIWFGAGVMLGTVLVAAELAHPTAVDDHEDLDLDPDAWDPAMDGSVAASDGLPHRREGDRDRRRSYWWWWLRTAVPTAAGLHGAPLDAVDAHRARQTRDLLAGSDRSAGLVEALGHRAPRDPTSWAGRDLKRQVRDERQRLQR